jgi:mono/diheme cytochrome c family protein
MSFKRNAISVAAPLLVLTASLAPSLGQDAVDGQALFVGACAGCHGAVGEGGYGPPLTDNEFIADAEAFVPRIVLGGELMPPFGHLADTEIAAIINFVRTELNEHSNTVDDAFVAGLRP